MNREAPMGEALLADQAYDRLIAVLRDGTLARGNSSRCPDWSSCSSCRWRRRGRR